MAVGRRVESRIPEPLSIQYAMHCKKMGGFIEENFTY